MIFFSGETGYLNFCVISLIFYVDRKLSIVCMGQINAYLWAPPVHDSSLSPYVSIHMGPPLFFKLINLKLIYF